MPKQEAIEATDTIQAEDSIKTVTSIYITYICPEDGELYSMDYFRIAANLQTVASQPNNVTVQVVDHIFTCKCGNTHRIGNES